MKQQWHPVVYFHKQVSYSTFTNFWLTSEFFFFFFFATGFQGTFPPFPPIYTTRTATIHPVISTSNGNQDAQIQAVSLLKGCISYMRSQKFKIVTEKLQHWYKTHFYIILRKTKDIFLLVSTRVQQIFCTVLLNPPPHFVSLQGSMFIFFLI